MLGHLASPYRDRTRITDGLPNVVSDDEGGSYGLTMGARGMIFDLKI